MNVAKVCSAKIVVGILLIYLSGTELMAQTNLRHITDKPVVGLETAAEFEKGGVWFPAVIKDGDTLKMWYTGFDRSAWKSNPKGHIGYVWSLDGIKWNKENKNPVLSAELKWEGDIVMTCAVIKDDSVYKMWYGANSYAPSVIGYATSADGKNWSKHIQPVLKVGSGDWDKSVIAPHTVIKEGDQYKMWYWGGNGWRGEPTVQVGFATSSDGITWEKYDDPTTTAAPFSSSDPVLKPGLLGEWDDGKLIAPMVVAVENGYEIWYNSTSKTSGDPYYIGHAISSDGIKWTKSFNNPVFSDFPNWGSWYGGGTILKYDKEFHFWYSLFHTVGKGKPQIGYSIFRIEQ